MPRWNRIIAYRGFYDVPRAFLTRLEGKWLYFDCPFNDQLDEYESRYAVFEMPALPQDMMGGDWREFQAVATRRVGYVAVAEVEFDPTRRHLVNMDAMDKIAEDAT